jgi:hypothetical protein
VDFICKAQGVNRPLLRNEPHLKDNLNKTYYRDQANKPYKVSSERRNSCSFYSRKTLPQSEI